LAKSFLKLLDILRGDLEIRFYVWKSIWSTADVVKVKAEEKASFTVD
jgi:hypothetical protein